MTGSHDKTSDEKDHDHEKTRSCDRICASTREGTVTTFAARKKDGREGWLLVSDFKGTAGEIAVDVKGVKDVASAVRLDHKSNIAPATVSFKDGRLLLEKTVKGSAAFLVKFRLKVLIGRNGDCKI